MSATPVTTNAPRERTPFSCLMVEDDLAFAAMVQQVIREEGGQPTHCKTLAEARAATSERVFDLVLLDNHLPDGKAYDFFDQISRCNPDAPIIMITGLPTLSEAIALTRNGLFDYLTKPVDTDALVACLRRAQMRMRRAESPDADLASFGNSPAMRGLLQQLGQAARHPAATVLLTGESGVGKDVAARMLHRLTFGDRAAETPYVALNCAAVPGEMFEAELFGAERGAYTGADKRRPGLVASAQGGTLFLDEIAEVPMTSQAKLLRFLESREFRPLGGTASESFTGRFVAATNKSLRTEVKAGKFREDLLYRIEVFTIEIPPLRERREEIPELSEHLLKNLASKYGRQTPLLRAEDMAALQGYSFPGNVRELRNILERGLLRTPEESRWLSLDLAWLTGAVSRPQTIASPVTASTVPTAGIVDDVLPADRTNLSPLEAQEYRMIRTALREANGGIRRAAAKVGLSPQALLRRLEKWPELRVDGK
jgi:two-component system response regulator AtoC